MPNTACAIDSGDLELLGAGTFRLSNDRRMITLDARIGEDPSAMRPRIYCTVENNGVVSALQTMPRLPLQPMPQRIVAK